MVELESIWFPEKRKSDDSPVCTVALRSGGITAYGLPVWERNGQLSIGAARREYVDNTGAKKYAPTGSASQGAFLKVRAEIKAALLAQKLSQEAEEVSEEDVPFS